MHCNLFDRIKQKLSCQVLHPIRWISGFIFLCFTPLLLTFFKPSVPPKKLEEILWTSDRSRIYFYGPGTPPSISRAKNLKEIIGKDYHLDNLFSDSIYIAPKDPSDLPETIIIVYPFNRQTAIHIKKMYEKQKSDKTKEIPRK